MVEYDKMLQVYTLYIHEQTSTDQSEGVRKKLQNSVRRIDESNYQIKSQTRNELCRNIATTATKKDKDTENRE
jgi:hypothetical protein